MATGKGSNMALTQAHYLLMLAEDARTRGDELSEEWREKATAHWREVHDLSMLIERARELVAREKARFQSYAPQGQLQEESANVQRQVPSHVIRPQVQQKKAE
jgi:hypothetical protein